MPRAHRSIIVTSALPYANGSIHIGHLVEYIQTDIWVRFQRLMGHDVTYVCGDDAHGTPIMLKSREAGVTPEEWIAKYHEEHKADFARFGIAFDNYYTTHSDLNRDLSYHIYDKVKAAGIISAKEIEQLFDPQANIFLPDRFVKGTCPNCKSPEQYGDSCEVCSKTFDPSDLINPVSVVSGATPVMKKSRHLFLNLEQARDFLIKLYEGGFVDETVKNKLLDWFKEPLRAWDISRDHPFFGFPIPGEEGKFFYNWFDAPIGYLASLGNKLELSAQQTISHWNDDIYERWHFIGKDIQYFHALFWPVMLNTAGVKVPTKLAIHGFLTVNGKKMSKRDGTFIKASTFAEHLDPQYLRYYFATKLGPTPEDLDLSFDDFQARINSELVGKLANLLSRGGQFLSQKLDGRTGVVKVDALAMLNALRDGSDRIAEAYDKREFAAATRMICELADKANKYVEDEAPWALLKKGDPEGARAVCTAALEAGRILSIYLKPVVPEFAAKVEKFLGVNRQKWENVQDSMEPRPVGQFERLADRVDAKAVEKMIEASKEGAKEGSGVRGQGSVGSGETPGAGGQKAVGAGQAAPAAKGGHPAEEALAATCTIEQFMAVDLRVGKVLSAEPVAGTDKMMKIQLDLGHLGQRTVFAGIAKAYTPERLIGRLVVCCANLAPRKMKFGTSEGMICAAGPGGSEVFVLTPDSGAKPGQRVH